MNRRQLAFVILLNAAISLVIALAVVWLFEARRPDPAEMAALVAPLPGAILAATPTAADLTILPTPLPVTPETLSDSASANAGAGEVGEQVVHVIQVGESLGSLATQYGVTIDALVRANNLTNPDFVFSGQRLIIPSAPDNGAGGAGAQSNAAAPLQGVEILAIEGAGELAAEAVLIANESDTPFNLNNWQLRRENGPVYTFGNVQLFPGSSVRIYSAAGEDDSQRLYWGQTASVWTDASVAQLNNADGLRIDTYTAEP